MDPTNAEEQFLAELNKLTQQLDKDLLRPADIMIDGYKLVCTSVACPEQYDVFSADEQQVGYLRLRHGIFRADYPDCGGETVYTSNPTGDGTFESEERLIELVKAIRAIDARHKKGRNE